MFQRILYALGGSLMGLVYGLGWDWLFGRELGDLSPWPVGLMTDKLILWSIAGLAVGFLWLDLEAIERAADRRRDSPIDPPPVVETQPARCAWCGGQGRRLFFFRCPVCYGQGNVLAVRPRKKCAWCRGTGRRFLFRCPACWGAGWLRNRGDRH